MTAKAVGKPRALRATSPYAPAAPADCRPGRAWPLGATPGEGGVNFAVFASGVDRVEVCLFDASGIREERRIALPARTDDVWHGFVEGAVPGTLYGLRVYGPYDPQNGWRCNPAKLLLDPYARKLDRPLRGAAWQYAYTLGHDKRDLNADPADNATAAAKCVVVDPAFDWGDDAHPATPMEDSVFYEVHVRGFTRQMPDV
ncbi:MAG TPA: glycogen debranching enzyme GlgX, partial [Ramlibacter sp.]